ncbi:uncharacterized protein LOC133205126 [Saccostrea echinata]|uniref:uncharacterized protein LOC133205126 n=1 Tax=Saccostrea echinata TaxID=191078 RepID=UPI002A80D66F|nr:uncharacterized protein LOC133205126 [Saccostrea echinata]
MFVSLLILALSVLMIPGSTSECCVPPQFQTYIDTMTSLSSTMDKRFQTLKFSYDAKSKKLRTHVVASSKEDEFDQIEDYSAVSFYNVICNSGDISVYVGAHLVRHSFMGVSPHIMKLETYMVTIESSLMGLTTVGENCTPVEMVSISSKTPQPDGQLMRIFYNMTMGIKDLSIFTPPEICFKQARYKSHGIVRYSFFPN